MRIPALFAILLAGLLASQSPLAADLPAKTYPNLTLVSMIDGNETWLKRSDSELSICTRRPGSLDMCEQVDAPALQGTRMKSVQIKGKTVVLMKFSRAAGPLGKRGKAAIVRNTHYAIAEARRRLFYKFEVANRQALLSQNVSLQRAPAKVVVALAGGSGECGEDDDEDSSDEDCWGELPEDPPEEPPALPPVEIPGNGPGGGGGVDITEAQRLICLREYLLWRPVCNSLRDAMDRNLCWINAAQAHAACLISW